MFIGEAPGELENAVGVPFVGKAGTILHQLFKMVHYQFQYLITNAVSCRPVDILWLDDYVDEKIEKKDFDLNDYVIDQDYQLIDWNRDPHPTEIEACSEHLQELIDNWQPSGIVHLGKIAQKALPHPIKEIQLEQIDSNKHEKVIFKNNKPCVRIPTLQLLHPAYIARMEYKLLTVVKEAKKLNDFLGEIHDF